ncbi:reverse ribonuclease integrase [Plakobranchus ocellatus]|uniref:Reverse ribonuclease integrase n=1 Tax=Plakobranchus ocellatus TaxID=259542 RepID=A0AAV4D0T3_9GAST|nr:reverse ribonuclease integrase [Plakobranchus ocellatus]
MPLSIQRQFTFGRWMLKLSLRRWWLSTAAWVSRGGVAPCDGWGSKETVDDLRLGNELSWEQRLEFEAVGRLYLSPGSTTVEEHRIELTSSTPFAATPVSNILRYEADVGDEMETLGIIRKTNSHYASPDVVVKKKDGSNVVCIDYIQVVEQSDRVRSSPHDTTCSRVLRLEERQVLL